MSTVLASAIINKALIVMQDETGTHWPPEELLGWLNEGQSAILIIKPNANVQNASLQLVVGTKQSLPFDGIQLIDIPRNMGLDGRTPGRTIKIAKREIFDAQVPDWHTHTASSAVTRFMYDPLDPKHFYTWPPQPATGAGFVEIIYSARPAPVQMNGVITLDDIYESVLLDYILYRAHSKDSTFGATSERAGVHQAAYLSALTGKVAVETAVNPNRTSMGSA